MLLTIWWTTLTLLTYSQGEPAEQVAIKEKLAARIERQIELSEQQAEKLNKEILALTIKLNKTKQLQELGVRSSSQEIQRELDELTEVQSDILVTISQLKLKKRFYFDRYE